LLWIWFLWLDGKIDEVRIYNTALTASEIKALYLNPGGLKSPLPGADITQTVIDGGLITSGRIELGSGGTIKAGINGYGTAGTDIRIWAGSTYDDRATAPFRVDQNGRVIGTSIGSILFSVFENYGMKIQGGLLWENEADGQSRISINYYGYHGGVTQYRDLAIGNGKGGNVVIIGGNSNHDKFVNITGFIDIIGNVDIRGNVDINGTLDVSDKVTFTKGRTPAGTLHSTNVTHNTIFDALKASIPANYDKVIVNGSYKDGPDFCCISYVIRTGTSYMRIYWINDDGGCGSLNITDGSGTTIDCVSIAW